MKGVKRLKKNGGTVKLNLVKCFDSDRNDSGSVLVLDDLSDDSCNMEEVTKIRSMA